MNEIRCIVAGSRGFDNRHVMDTVLDHVFSKAHQRGDKITILSGGARGADRMGEAYARRHASIALERFPANWDRDGRGAGFIRNEKMACNATHLIVFWDGESRGTKNMLDTAILKGLEIRVFSYKGNLLATHHAPY